MIEGQTYGTVKQFAGPAPKNRIMLFCDWYEPGFKAGGPIRSCVNFVQQMNAEFELYVFTSDRDFGQTEPYPGIQLNNWNQSRENVKIYYCSPAKLNWEHIGQQIKSVKPNFIYLNSMYSRFFTLYPLLRQKFLGGSGCKLILAPRGMLKQSAIDYKKNKKKIFLNLFKALGLHKNISFHATDQEELNQITKIFGTKAKGMMIPNFPAGLPAYGGTFPKETGELKMIFVGRLHPIKNLDLLLEHLSKVKGKVRLSVVGSEEDAEYVEKCRNIAGKLPENVAVDFLGAIPNQQLPGLLSQHHIFALLTRGENFGHAIFEALSQGKPVLISDQTPWRCLEANKAGWDLPLTSLRFSEKIQQAINFSHKDYEEWSNGAWRFAEKFVAAGDLKSDYKKLFS